MPARDREGHGSGTCYLVGSVLLSPAALFPQLGSRLNCWTRDQSPPRPGRESAEDVFLPSHLQKDAGRNVSAGCLPPATKISRSSKEKFVFPCNKKVQRDCRQTTEERCRGCVLETKDAPRLGQEVSPQPKFGCGNSELVRRTNQKNHRSIKRSSVGGNGKGRCSCHTSAKYLT